MFPISILGALSGIGAVTYTVYYLNIQRKSLSPFPEPVAKHLRRALYYTNQSPDPKKAIHEYQQAILVADNLNMDPFTPEMLGVKVQVAAFFENLGRYQQAIDILEQVRADCLKWNEFYGDKPENAEKRRRLLSTAVQLSVKLGEYYSHPSIAQREAAEQKMSWAVTAILKEQQQREQTEANPGDDAGWIDSDQRGGAIEALADHYAAHSRHYLSAPLYLQAISFSPPRSCHTVVLMNNLAIALALEHPPSTSNQPNPPRADQMSSARAWANKAIALAESIKPPERTEECDEGCAVATTNLGDFAGMTGDFEEAERRWAEALFMSKKIGFQRGQDEAMLKLELLAKEQARVANGETE